MQAEFLAQLFTPLLYQSRWCDDEDALGHLSHQVLFDHQPGFDGFAQADLVAQQTAPAKATQCRLGDFYLVGKGVEVEGIQANEFVKAGHQQHRQDHGNAQG